MRVEPDVRPGTIWSSALGGADEVGGGALEQPVQVPGADVLIEQDGGRILQEFHGHDAIDLPARGIVPLLGATRRGHGLAGGDLQDAETRMPLDRPLAVRLTDPLGAGVGRHPVTFTVTRGDGRLEGSTDDERRALTVLTDANGEARARFSVGGNAGVGNQRVTATSMGVLSSLTFTASARHGPVTAVYTLMGDRQTGFAGQALPWPLVVSVQDVEGNPVAGVAVRFQVQGGTSALVAAQWVNALFRNPPAIVDPRPTIEVITDRDGRAAATVILGPEAGPEIAEIKASVVGLPEARTTTLVASAVSGSGDPADTALVGTVLSTEQQPIPGVTLVIDGTTIGAVSDADGRFAIVGAPPGHRHLLVNGTTANRDAIRYPTIGFEVDLLAGATLTMPMPIYLPIMDRSNEVLAGGDEEVALHLPGMPGVEVIIAPHSTIRADGVRGPVWMWTSPVNAQAIPMPPPGGIAPVLAATLQPSGTRLDPPARIRWPNMQGLRPGAQTFMLSFDHDLGAFVSQGTVTVDGDGAFLSSDAGSGLGKAGWHFPGGTPIPTGDCTGMSVNFQVAGPGDIGLGQRAPYDIRFLTPVPNPGPVSWSTQVLSTADLVLPDSTRQRIDAMATVVSCRPEDDNRVSVIGSLPGFGRNLVESRIRRPSVVPAIGVPGESLDVVIHPIFISDWSAATAVTVGAGGCSLAAYRTLQQAIAGGGSAGSSARAALDRAFAVTRQDYDPQTYRLSLGLAIGSLVPATEHEVQVQIVDGGVAGPATLRLLRALKTVKPDIVAAMPSAPAFAECLPRRSGTADEPVIIMTGGGDRSVDGCSLIGTEEGDGNRWSFAAKCDAPVVAGDAGAYAVVWELGGGRILAGAAGSGQGGGTPTITVEYPAGRYTPVLKVYRTEHRQTTLVGTAAIHAITVHSRAVDGAAWTSAPVAEDDRCGAETTLERRADEGEGITVHVGVAVQARGASRARVSPDGYPQNEYWVTSADSGDLPQPYVFAPGGTGRGWTQGYGEPSSSADDLSVRIPTSQRYGGDATDARFTTVLLEAGVDGDRDGTIRFDDADRTSGLRPYRFWINDDHDALVSEQDQPGVSPGRYAEEDDTTGSANASDRFITCPRDLEDFMRLHLRWRQPALAEGGLSAATVEVRWRPRGGGPGGMGLNLAAEGDGGSKYLEEWGPRQAADHQSQDGEEEWYSPNNNGSSRFSTRAAVAAAAWQAIAVPAGGSTLSDMLAAFMADRSQGLMPFVAEGIARGSGRLECRVRMQGRTVARAGVWIDLVRIEELFERWSCGHVANAVPVPAVAIGAGRVYDREARSGTATIIHVHGWNMTDQAGGAQDRLWFAATMYKRLWWQGYRGRFISFEWPTNDAGLSFDESEFSAWLTGARLATVVVGTTARFPGEPVHLTAHSQGNVVAGEALRRLAAQGRSGIIGTYIAMQAAMPANAWDGSVSDRGEDDAAAFAGKVDAYRGWVNDRAGSGGAGLDAVGKAFSIGNSIDYAMTGLGWSSAQSTKPDGGGAPTAVYGTWNYYMRDPVVAGAAVPDGSRLYRAKGTFSVERVVLPWNRADPANLSSYADLSNVALLGPTNPVRAGITPASDPDVARYEAMSFGAPGRWPPLACVAAGAGPAGFTSIDGTRDANYWFDLRTLNQSFNQHRWHSAQFRMNAAKQNKYWRSIHESIK